MMKKKLITSIIMSGLLISGLANANNNFSEDIKFTGMIKDTAPEWEVSLVGGFKDKLNNIQIDMSSFTKSGDTRRYTLFNREDDLTVLKAVMKGPAATGQSNLAPQVSFQNNEGQNMVLEGWCFEGTGGCESKLTIDAINTESGTQIGVLEITVNGEYAVLSKTVNESLLHTNRAAKNYASEWLLSMDYAKDYDYTSIRDSNYTWFNQLLEGTHTDQQNIAAAIGVGFQKVEFIAEDKPESSQLRDGPWEATTNVSVTWN
ncbi:Fimbrial, major and minor subunit [Vibrio mediterranei]|uniref:F4 family fimbrial subunit n=2 Tax=Vibrio mediterranei TaxID=689 RepID=UPI0007811564|nr:hypothetical protein [Vibrio mediterranei]MCG9662205.1 hypothetical protein [Vibrio mediterranei]SBO09579.1 Fimbrial, major and minor subunit [Vibrio mediterranei]